MSRSPRERVLELQTRSMKDNLLFGGIPESHDDADAAVKDFIKTELEIPDEVNCQVVHRLRPRDDGKLRSIFAKFTNRKDREEVHQAAPAKLADKRPYSVNE